MTDLSANEAELLYAIKNDQGRTLTFYGDELRKHHTQLTRALEHLKLAGYVRATENNRLYISDEFKQRQQATPEPESVEETVVELAAVVDVPEAQPVLKTEPAPVHEAGMKTTPEMIAAYMADGVERTAAVIAQQFGHAKGTTLINPLRKLVTDGLLVKTGTVYSLPVTVEKVVEAVAEVAQEIVEVKPETVATESDDDLAARLIAVLEKSNPAEPDPVVEYHNETLAEDREAAQAHAEKPRGNLPTLFSGELQNHILKKRNAFTAGEIMLDFAESHYIDKNRFDEIFEDVACSGDLMCWDGVEFIDPTLEYAPGSTYIVLRKTEPTDAIGIMDEYCENIREPYKLFDIVETTHIHHADVLRYLVDFDFDVTNHEHIVKGPHTSDVSYSQKTAVSASPKAGTFPSKTYPVRTTPNFSNKEYKPFRPKSDRDAPLISYAMIENLKPSDITDFLDGGVKVSVFIRKFNLHPDDEKHIVEVLTLTGVAELTSVEGVDWLFLKNRSSVQLSSSEIGSLTAPTGEPARKWTPVEKENLRDALKTVAQAEDRLTTAKDLDPSAPDVVPSGDISALMKDALHAIVDSEEEQLTKEKIGTLRDRILESTLTPSTVFMSRELADELQVPITECICEHRTFGDELHEAMCPVAELENDFLSDQSAGPKGGNGPQGPSGDGPTGPQGIQGRYAIGLCHKAFCKVHRPNEQWALTLKMLEERLRFEHQGSAADQLHEIRKYLEP